MTQRYILELEVLNGDSRPAIIRLRGLLKLALRQFGFRCTRCGWTTLPRDRTNPNSPGVPSARTADQPRERSVVEHESR